MEGWAGPGRDVVAGCARGRGAPDIREPGPAQALRRLLLDLSGRQQEPQPALVHHGGVRHRREEAPLRRKTRRQARSWTAWRLRGSPDAPPKEAGAGGETGPPRVSFFNRL